MAQNWNLVQGAFPEGKGPDIYAAHTADEWQVWYQQEAAMQQQAAQAAQAAAAQAQQAQQQQQPTDLQQVVLNQQHLLQQLTQASVSFAQSQTQAQAPQGQPSTADTKGKRQLTTPTLPDPNDWKAFHRSICEFVADVESH